MASLTAKRSANSFVKFLINLLGTSSQGFFSWKFSRRIADMLDYSREQNGSHSECEIRILASQCVIVCIALRIPSMVSQFCLCGHHSDSHVTSHSRDRYGLPVCTQCASTKIHRFIAWDNDDPDQLIFKTRNNLLS